MATLTTPEFISRDPQQVLAEIKSAYETEVGKTVQPGQVEMFIFNAMAYRESVLRSGIQAAALQNLVNFGEGVMLDFLGQLVGVERLAPSAAKTTILFTLVDGHADVVIPSGTRIQSTDGKVIFVTPSDKTVLEGIDEIEIECECTKEGIIGNGYLAGEISEQLDPLAYVTSAENISTTAAGSDQEIDAEFRERIKQAPNSFSVAGPKGAYLFWAKSANSNIIDVAVTSTEAGIVEVYPLMADGSVTPSEVIDAVEAILDDEKIRPLCDRVEVYSPTKIDYDLEVELTVYPDAVQQDVIDAVEAILEKFTIERRSSLGKDVISDQVKSLCILRNSTTGLPDSVYSADLIGFTDIVVEENEFAYCNSILVTVVGTNVG